MPMDLARYGLRENPFFIKQALDPRLSSRHENILTRVDGFTNVPEVEKHIKDAAGIKQPPIFMITGKSGTGRSSLANYVLMQYCKLSGIPSDKLIVPQREIEGHEKMYTIPNWFSNLQTDIGETKIGLSGKLEDDLDRLFKNVTEATLEPKFRGIANRLSNEISTQPHNYKFACCIENVEDFKIVDAFMNVFRGVPTICVFTVEDYKEQQEQIIAKFDKKCEKLIGSTILPLAPLSGDEVRNLADHIWRQVSDLANPFDLDCIAQAFGNKQRPIGLALKIMADLITEKLALCPDGNAWPDAPDLKFDCDQLCRLVPILEKRI